MKSSDVVERIYPASIGQKRWMRHYRRNSSNEPFFWDASYRLTGSLDRMVLQRAAECVIDRHETLRTALGECDGRIVQIVHRAEDQAMVVEDVSEMAEPIREAAARELISRVSQQCKQLSGPLFRILLIKISAEEHVLSLFAAEAVCDGSSRNLLLADIAWLYRLFLAGGQPPKRPSIQYGDFAQWQARQADCLNLKQQREFWLKQLSHFPEPEFNISARLGSAARSYKGSQLAMNIGAAGRKCLGGIAAERQSTLFTVFVATLCAGSGIWAKSDYAVVGSTADYRACVQFKDLIGLFTSSIRLCVDMSGRTTFVEMIDRCRVALMEAYGNQDFPLENVIEEIEPFRNLYQYPPFAIKLILQEWKRNLIELPGLTVTPFMSNPPNARCDLTIALVDNGDSVSGTITYDTGRLLPADVGSIVNRWQSFIRLASQNPDRSIANLAEAAEMTVVGC